MYCPKCGQPVDAGAKFCAKCGAPMAVAPPPQQPKPPPAPPQPPSFATPPQAGEPEVAAPTPPTPAQPPSFAGPATEKPLSDYLVTLFVPGLWQLQHKDTTKGFVMLAIALLLLCTTCVGYFAIGFWSMLDARDVDSGKGKRW
jgi:hypothetical protein